MVMGSKNVFWQALILTVAVFIIGIFMGVIYESSNLSQISSAYSQSEVLMMDAFALNNVVVNASDCQAVLNSNVNLADRIYSEASVLENYENSQKLTPGFQVEHQKYDLMRTLLWMDSTKMIDSCSGNFSLVVYLYQYTTSNLNQKAKQAVWSNILYDLKQKEGNRIILIPIAVDSNLSSLNYVLSQYKIPGYPTVIIDNKYVLSNITSVSDVEKYLR